MVYPVDPPGSLRGPSWFLTWVIWNFQSRNLLYLSREKSVEIWKSLPFLEVTRLLCVSKVSSNESLMTSLIPDWSKLFCSQWKRTRLSFMNTMSSQTMPQVLDTKHRCGYWVAPQLKSISKTLKSRNTKQNWLSSSKVEQYLQTLDNPNMSQISV